MNSKVFSPDYSRDAVFRPCSRKPFEFYGKDKISSFCIEQDKLTAWWCINLCHLSYCSFESISELLPEECKLEKIFHVRTQMAYAVTIQGYTLLIFQGSRGMEDTILDLKFLPAKAKSHSMHSGFITAYNYLKPEIDKYLDTIDSSKLILCGHSLGGALASILATERSFHSLYTFGAPRVLFGFSKMGNEENVFRYVNCSDAVTSLPPAVFGYRHFGKMIFIDASQQIHEDIRNRTYIHKAAGSAEYFLKCKWASTTNAATKSLVDHAPVNYSRALSRHLIESELDN